MSKTTIIFISLVVIVVGVIAAYSLFTNSQQITPIVTVDSQKPGNVQEVVDNLDEPAIQTGGSYAPFSPEVLSSTSNTRRVLFFYANWCPTCRPVDQSLSQNSSKLPDEVTVIRVNYDDSDTDQAEKDLAAQYGVTYQHTFVQIDAQGNAVTKWNGGSIDELLENIQ